MLTDTALCTDLWVRRPLTPGAPEHGAACQGRGGDEGPASMARTAAAPVGMPAQVGFFIGGALGGLRPARRRLFELAGRDDHARAFSVRQQDDRIRPELPEFLDAYPLAGRSRVDALSKEQLGPIDVADPGDDALIHEQFSDRAAGRPDGMDEGGRIRIAEQRVRTQAGTQRTDLGDSKYLAS